MVQNRWNQPLVREVAKQWPSRNRLQERTARFDSDCPKCKQRIFIGDDILWEPGYAIHKECPEAGQNAPQRPTAPRPNRGFMITPDEPLWLVTNLSTDEAVYTAELEQAFDWITIQVGPQPEENGDAPNYESAVRALNEIGRPELTDEQVETAILQAEQEEPLNEPDHSKIPDGTYTVVFNDNVDDYVTVRLQTKGPNSNYFGKQIAQYLAGPDNGADYVGFAFIENGICRVWKRFREDGKIAKYVKAINALSNGGKEAQGEAGLTYAMRSGHCFRCGRELTVPTSLHRGLGPDCAEKF